MRRLITMGTVALAAIGLSACGGDPADLTQDKARSALIDAGDLPDGGWTAGAVSEDKPKAGSTSSEDILKDAKDVSQECRPSATTSSL